MRTGAATLQHVSATNELRCARRGSCHPRVVWIQPQAHCFAQLETDLEMCMPCSGFLFQGVQRWQCKIQRLEKVGTPVPGGPPNTHLTVPARAGTERKTHVLRRAAQRPLDTCRGGSSLSHGRLPSGLHHTQAASPSTGDGIAPTHHPTIRDDDAMGARRP